MVFYGASSEESNCVLPDHHQISNMVTWQKIYSRVRYYPQGLVEIKTELKEVGVTFTRDEINGSSGSDFPASQSRLILNRVGSPW